MNMDKFKYLLTAIILASLLVVAQPSVSSAQKSNIEFTIPAIVLVQNKTEKMLVNHNFESDSKIYIPMEKDTDSGFYVTMPGSMR
ncbi:MAG: hypothetical protein N3I35_17190 [Clostridia bacterium]|nr:hypothetical protein [Clostridia bacterium]